VAAEVVQMERDLSAIRRSMRKPLDDVIAKSSLTVPQRTIMQVVVGCQGIRLKDLSHEVNLAHSTVSGIVDRLEKQELIERRSDPTDRRVSRIYPSGNVDKFVRTRIPALRRGPLSKALERASTEEHHKIGWALRRLRELLENR
jgi:DNA-binding MarR family transcriptional regulator